MWVLLYALNNKRIHYFEKNYFVFIGQNKNPTISLKNLSQYSRISDELLYYIITKQAKK